MKHFIQFQVQEPAPVMSFHPSGSRLNRRTPRLAKTGPPCWSAGPGAVHPVPGSKSSGRGMESSCISLISTIEGTVIKLI